MHERPILGPPPAPDLAGRVPTLEYQDAPPLSHADIVSHRRALAASVAVLVLLPWAAWKAVDAGLLGWADGLALTGAGWAVALVGVAWAALPLRAERARLRARIRATSYQTSLTWHAWAGLINGFDAAVAGLYGRHRATPGPDPTVISPASLNDELTALRTTIRTLPAQLAGAIAEAAPVVTPQLREGAPPSQDSDTGPDLVDLLTVAADYQGGPMAALVGAVLRGQPYSRRALTTGDGAIMEGETYRAALDRLTTAGCFLAGTAGKAAEPAAQLVSYRARWAIADGDAATQQALEEAAHTWALGRLAGAPITLYVPSPTA
jgi:hypothetical protein